MLIPRFINVKELIPFLDQLAAHAEMDSLDLDFTNLATVTPAGLVALTAFVAHRKRRKLSTQFLGFEKCCIAGYLRRMDLPR